MDFITSLPKTTKKRDVIMVVVGKSRKSTHLMFYIVGSAEFRLVGTIHWIELHLDHNS
jgi:hypothetical protein